MLKRPDDWRVAYFVAQAAEEGQRAKERAAMGRAIALGIALGVLGSIAALWVG